jgi:hypothetical protein
MEKQPNPEEIAKNQESRTLSDAELIKGGAKYVKDAEEREPRLHITDEQFEKIKEEMRKEIEDEKRVKETKEDEKRHETLRSIWNAITLFEAKEGPPKGNIELETGCLNCGEGFLRGGELEKIISLDEVLKVANEIDPYFEEGVDNYYSWDVGPADKFIRSNRCGYSNKTTLLIATVIAIYKNRKRKLEQSKEE